VTIVESFSMRQIFNSELQSQHLIFCFVYICHKNSEKNLIFLTATFNFYAIQNFLQLLWRAIPTTITAARAGPIRLQRLRAARNSSPPFTSAKPWVSDTHYTISIFFFPICHYPATHAKSHHASIWQRRNRKISKLSQ
jgi:hypothetical protein